MKKIVRTIAASAMLASFGVAMQNADESNASASQSGAPHGEYSEMEEVQAPLSAAANAISAVIEAEALPGWAGTSIRGGRVTVYWQGNAPEAVRRVVESLQGSVEIAIVAARYSRAELQATADRILQKELAKPEAERINGFDLMTDGSGLVGLAETVSPGMEAEFIAAEPMVIGLKEEGPVVPMKQRQDDANPWSGGAAITTSASCSTSFGISDRVFGVTWMLSAAHCTNREREIVLNGDGDGMGFVRDRLPSRDLMTVEVAGSTDAHVYDGSWNNTAGYRKPVTGWVRNYDDEYLCFSAAFTGIRCNILIVNDSASRIIEGVVVHDLVVGDSTDGFAIIGGGDSGGPAFGHVPNTTPPYRWLLARGTLLGSQGKTISDCEGIQVEGRECARKAVYMPISVALNSFGAELVIGGP